MARRIVENPDLPTAVRWEEIREQWHRLWGRHDIADQCRELADHFQSRLNDHLQDQLR